VALPPISGQTIRPQAQPSRSVTDARAAQRAFFEAALGKVQATPTVQRAAPTATAAAAARPSPILTTAPPAEPSPDRPMRPGSLVNIVV
jgi:hypothetical protein